MNLFERLFIAHPRSLGESYIQHQRFALSFAKTLFSAGVAAAVHAVFPCLFKTTASEAVVKLHGTMFSRASAAKRETGP